MESRALTVSEFRQKLIDESTKKKILLSASIEITSTCCFKCRHCYIDKANCGFMQLSSFARILKELKKQGCVYLTLTGGEATLHPQFREMYLLAYNSGFIITLFSNGYQIDKYVDILSVYKPYEIDITLYGIDNESYKENTGVSDGEKVLDNLSLLKKHNIQFSLKATVTKEILPYIERMKQLARAYDVTFRSDLFIYLSKQQSTGINRLTPSEIANILLDDQRYVELERKALTANTQSEKTKLYSCQPGETNIYITWDELAKICPFTSNEHAVDISKGENSIEKARRYFAKFSLCDIPVNHKCFKCKYISTCRRCPERFFLETNNYNDPPCWMCETSRLIYEGISAQIAEGGENA